MNLAYMQATLGSRITSYNVCYTKLLRLHLAMDGISLLMVALTGLLGVLAVTCSWKEIQDRVGFFHLNLLWILGGVVGVFLSLDLFLFFFFWERNNFV